MCGVLYVRIITHNSSASAMLSLRIFFSFLIVRFVDVVPKRNSLFSFTIQSSLSPYTNRKKLVGIFRKNLLPRVVRVLNTRLNCHESQYESSKQRLLSITATRLKTRSKSRFFVLRFAFAAIKKRKENDIILFYLRDLND